MRPTATKLIGGPQMPNLGDSALSDPLASFVLPRHSLARKDDFARWRAIR